MLPLFRLLPRQLPRLKIKRAQPLLLLRPQHDNYGPHKEYFQHPSQFPSHAYQLKVPPPEERARTSQQQQRFQTPPHDARAKKPPFIRRLIRSTLVISLSLALGWAAGTAVITWDYIQPPFEPGSEEAEELIEDVATILETCSLVQDLRECGFQEEQIHRPSTTGQNFVTDTLNDVQGFKTKFFRHPEHTGLSILVFFAGFGIEGFPDYVHNGAITTIMTEAVQQHCVPMIETSNLEALPSGQFANILFIEPIRPAEVYAVLVREETASIRFREIGDLSGYHDDGKKNEIAVAHGLSAFLVFTNSFHAEMLESFGGSDPKDESTSNEAQASQHAEGASSEGTEGEVEHIGLPQGAVVHVYGQIDVMTKSNNVERREGETQKDYGDRLAQETQRVLEAYHHRTRIRHAGSRESQDTR